MTGLFSFQRSILFPRHYTHPDPNAGQDIPGLERIWIKSEKGVVESWFLPGRGVDENHPGPVVLFAHGNAELIEYWPDTLAGYRRMGISVYLPEYRGYGRSAGFPSQKAINNDFIQFFDMLVKRPDVDNRQVIFHGRSIGGGVVCSLAEHRKPAAMILQSTFTSISNMSRKFLIPGFLILDPFDNLSVVSKLDIPILIIHGRQDDLIPFKHGEKLHQAAKHARLIAYQCDHNSCPPDLDRYWKDVQDFLSSLPKGGTR